MATIKQGDVIPFGNLVTIPHEDDDVAACGNPTKFTTDEWKGKKIVLFAVPGAFTPACHVSHLPGFVAKYEEFKAKGVDEIIVLSASDAFVMNAWAKASHLKGKITAVTDPEAAWSKALGLSIDLTGVGIGLGVRTARYALIIDDLVVKYVGAEPERDITVSGADAVLAALQGEKGP